MYRTIIFPVVLNGCKTWSLTFREDCRLRVLRIIFGPKREEVTESGENFIMWSSMICIPYPLVCG
jgi:hypothetical protein